MAHEFFNFIEHLIEDQIPEQLKNILLLTGFSCRTSFLNTSNSWLEDIEEFIRSQSECDYYRNRMPHGLNLQHFSLPPGYKAILIGIKSRLEHHRSNTQNERIVATPAVCNIQHEQSTNSLEQNINETLLAPSTSNSYQTTKPLSVEDATDILNNVLRCWERTHEITTTVKYNIANKFVTSATGEHIVKISATVMCPECDKPIQVYMDELKRRWIVSNLNSHFNRLHRRNLNKTADEINKQQSTTSSSSPQQRYTHVDYINFYSDNNTQHNNNNSEDGPQEVQYDAVTRSFYGDGGGTSNNSNCNKRVKCETEHESFTTQD